MSNKPLSSVLWRLDNLHVVSKYTGISIRTLKKIMHGEKEPTRTQLSNIRSYLKDANSIISRYIRENKMPLIKIQ